SISKSRANDKLRFARLELSDCQVVGPAAAGPMSSEPAAAICSSGRNCLLRLDEPFQRAQFLGEKRVDIRRYGMSEDRRHGVEGTAIGKSRDARRPHLRRFDRRPAPPVEYPQV